MHSRNKVPTKSIIKHWNTAVDCEVKLMLEETDKHLQNLPVREYAVITCLYINEMSVKETAKELGIKPNTVSTHKKNATARIRKKMEDK